MVLPINAIFPRTVKSTSCSYIHNAADTFTRRAVNHTTSENGAQAHAAAKNPTHPRSRSPRTRSSRPDSSGCPATAATTRRRLAGRSGRCSEHDTRCSVQAHPRHLPGDDGNVGGGIYAIATRRSCQAVKKVRAGLVIRDSGSPSLRVMAMIYLRSM